MIKNIKTFYEQNPLGLILLVAFLFRCISAIFSKGYGMHDDHFLVIEPAQSWVDGADYNNWLPSPSNPNAIPSGHSLFYPGLHYLLFRVLEFTGMNDPQSKMYVVRFLHACWSMVIVYLGFKLAYRKGGLKAAKMAGWLLAILFFMPVLSVRNLVEFTCIPPLLAASYLVVVNDTDEKKSPFIYAGLLLSMAFSIRFQTLLFIGGFMLALLILKKWRPFLYSGIGLLIGLLVVQFATDILIWQKPFVELKEYVRYNIENAQAYMTQRWYTYLLLIGGILIPPISLFLIFGFMRSWRKHLILFLPSFLFFVFHSSFPNKQERFILPVIPFIIILGSIGWRNYMDNSVFWLRNSRLYRALWIFFLFLNTIPLLFVSVAYSHRSRVEAMYYLYGKKDVVNVLIEESNHNDFTMPPRFYLGVWKTDYYITKIHPVDSLRIRLKNSPNEWKPNYVVFNQPANIGSRIVSLQKLFPDMTYEATIEPGFIDKVMTRLNKRNSNYTSYIFKLGNPVLE